MFTIILIVAIIYIVYTICCVATEQKKDIPDKPWNKPKFGGE